MAAGDEPHDFFSVWSQILENAWFDAEHPVKFLNPERLNLKFFEL